MSRRHHRCHECGKHRVNITVYRGRDLCPECRAIFDVEGLSNDELRDIVAQSPAFVDKSPHEQAALNELRRRA